jgi:putative phosphoribosyl transferase
VASTEACAYLRHEADACACIVETEQMYAVGMWYDDFSPTGDQDVIDLLADAERRSTHQLASTTG